MADSIYWSNLQGEDIRGAPLAGGGTVDTVFSAAGSTVSDGPYGLTIDAAAGRIYWASYFANKIQRAPLAPGGTVETLYSNGDGVNNPIGIAIHPAAGLIYWSNIGDNTIRRAPLIPHGTVETLYSGATEGVVGPGGVTIDPAAGRIYWANGSDNTIRGAPLAPHGHVDTLHGPTGVSIPWWVAIDPAAGRIYWTHWLAFADGRISGGRLGGGGAIDTLYDSAHGVSNPTGLAIDPNPAGPAPERLEPVRGTERFTAGGWLGSALARAEELFRQPTPSPGLIYWGNGHTTSGGFAPPNPNDLKIQRAPLAGSGTVETLYSAYAQGVNYPGGLALLRAPIGVVPPTISWQWFLSEGPFPGPLLGPPGPGFDHVEQRLTCSPGTWAPDLLGSFLYRAPQTFAYKWMRNGTDLPDFPDPTKSHYTPTAAGSYKCRVTATNHAGSSTQTSAAFAVSSSMLP